MSENNPNVTNTGNNPNQQNKPMEEKILYLFTRTPLHVGAGASVGAIDQPIIRERHTGFPIIPATSLKGTFADEWNESQPGSKVERSDEGKWLFGETDANNAAAGAIQFTEAKLLAFPIRSAKGSFAWITCPLILRRAVRDGALKVELQGLRSPTDEKALYDGGNGSPIDLGGKIVLEEYTFTQGGALPNGLADAMAKLISDPVWAEVASRLIILSDGMMSFFVQNACEIAQHVRIDDATGTAATGALFNQENVPSETLFYSVVHFLQSRVRAGNYAGKTAADAAQAFGAKLGAQKVFQFGGDASTGLGYCTLKLA
ncbi:MAG: type III-B CRISPR module RAMP protein Cmr4 [Verrucomicrobiae bacterium]|nr:type III-B CRISPR module RAMP protein Cmr4 [Verrucomicrobiae bacterium]